jgi:Fe-S-cluster containining protein
MTDHFYAEGLRFECTRCSRCCRHAPGFVFLSLEDLKRLADAALVSPLQFVQRYCREVRVIGIPRISLRERDNYDCILWQEGGCSLYAARPLQCRSYPFWSGNVSSPESWAAVSAECPGVGQGRLHSAEEIDRWLTLAAGRSLLASASDLR